MRYLEFPDGWLIAVFGIIMLAILLLAGSVGAATLTVNASGGADYTKIQDGIDNASAGDTVLIYSGTYYDNVNVNKPLILKGVDTGWGKPVVNAMGSGNAITLHAGNSTLEGFTVVNASTFDYGIYLYFSSNSTLSSNNVSSNGGIYLYYSGNSTLIGNNVKTSRISGYAINLFNSSDNKLIGNNLSDNFNGIYLSDSNNTLIGNNNVSNSKEGILISSSGNNTLISNNVLNNGKGIILASSTGNILSENNILDNREGIYLGGSSSNTLISNTALNNSEGIYLYMSSDNNIYNNLFNNTNNLRIFEVFYNKWNITITNGTNIVGGPSLGGNVWANPGGTAFSQTCEDVNDDGMCDSSYTIDSNNTDYLPLAYTHEFPTVIINLSGTPVVNQSTIHILSVDYRNFNADSPYNISITRKDDDSIVYTDNGMLKGGREETILINWIPIITGEYLIESKGNNTIVGNKTMFAVNPGSKMLTVDDNGDADYMSIQDAVDNASDGDVILVYSGTYGGVYINKQLILKGIDTGGGKPIIDASVGCIGYYCTHYGPGNAVTLQSGNSTLDGFTVIGGWSFAIPRSGGIDVVSNNNLIKNNTISENEYGLILKGSANTLSGNEILNNGLIGIDLEGSGNIIYNNLLNNSNNFEIYNNSSIPILWPE